MYDIPFVRPTIVGLEMHYMALAIQNGHLAGDGEFTQKCNALIANILGAPKALLTTSCTSALEMAALLLEIAPGDEVVVPSFTFVSTPNAFVLRGAKPIFIDIRNDTLNMDDEKLERLITPRTKAIIPVHYAGVGCEMDAICDVAARYNVSIVEDNAHGLLGKYRGRYLGSFGVFATQSFHETKNFTCGEGGALIINNASYVERAEILREKGTNRSRFFRGQVDKYSWVDIGSSYLPSDLLAAFLYAQLEERELIQRKRETLWNYYYTNLREWAAANHVRLPIVPSHCDQAYHMFYLIMPTLESRQNLINYLKSNRIQSVFHYLPLHLSVMGSQFGGHRADCPVTEYVSDRLIRLPFYHELMACDQQKVIDIIKNFKV
jgi:dTDP-4-amino-4,6-dideoxygalactose transaminase